MAVEGAAGTDGATSASQAKERTKAKGHHMGFIGRF